MRWRPHPLAIGMIVLICAVIGCDRDAEDGEDETSYELPEQYETVAGMRFERREDRLVTECIVRGDRVFVGCEDCPVACSQYELRRGNGSTGGAVPEGLHYDGVAQGDIVVRAEPRRIKVDGRPAVALRGGEVDSSYLSGLGSLRIGPVLESLHERQTRLGERSEEPEELGATLHIEPAHRGRLLLAMINTTLEIDPDQLHLAVAGHDSVEFELACRGGEPNRHLFKTDDDGEALDVEPRGGADQANWFCRDASDAPSGDDWKQTSVALDKSRTVPIANRILSPEESMDDEPDAESLKVSIGTDGFSVVDVDRNRGGGRIVEEAGEPISPVEGCPGDGPTVCLLRDKRDAKELFEAAREEVFEAARENGAKGMYNRSLKEASDSYDFEALAQILTDWHDETEEPSDVVTVAVDDDVPVALVIEIFDLLRGEGKWEGERRLFEDVELKPILTDGGPDRDAPDALDALAQADAGDSTKMEVGLTGEEMQRMIGGDLRPKLVGFDGPGKTDGEKTAADDDFESDEELDRDMLEPTVVPGEPETEGALDREIIERVVRQNRRDIQNCYELELDRDFSLEGRITIQWVISTGGDVITATVEETTMNSAAVEKCSTRRIERWSFPEPDGGGIVRVNYPFEFSAR